MGLRLDFIPLGTDLVDPLSLEEALDQAIFNVPSATISYWPSDDGEIKITNAMGDDLLSISARQNLGGTKIVRALQTAQLRAFVQNPDTGAFLRVPKEYWYPCRHFPDLRLRPIEEATGLSSSMADQPILVERQALAAYTEIASSYTDDELAAARSNVEAAKANYEAGHEAYVTWREKHPKDTRHKNPDRSPAPAERASADDADDETTESRVQIVSTAAAIKECTAWLCEEFADQKTATKTKNDFKTEALSQFAGRLTGRGFRTSWESAVEKFPDRSGSGPKTGRT